MAGVLMVYREASLYQADAVPEGRTSPVYSVSVDEKPAYMCGAPQRLICRRFQEKYSGIDRTTSMFVMAH